MERLLRLWHESVNLVDTGDLVRRVAMVAVNDLHVLIDDDWCVIEVAAAFAKRPDMLGEFA